MERFWGALICGIVSVVVSLPVSILCRAFLGFPTPFYGYEVGFKNFAALRVFLGIWGFYGMLGGFFVLGMMGVITGFVVSLRGGYRGWVLVKKSAIWGVIVSSVFVVFLSVLGAGIKGW